MILDEPLTAMIPPPDLWGSTGYTANNNKVGDIVMFFLRFISINQVYFRIITNDTYRLLLNYNG